jgi:hypothetical protein
MSNIGEMLNAYQKKTDCTRAEIARRTGVPERRLRAIMAEGREPIQQEEVFLTSWLKSVGFSYVPQEEATEDVPKASPKKKAAKTEGEKSEGVSIRGDAKKLVRLYKEAMGFKTDADAATALVKKGFMSVLKEASDVK